jgi:hypothetical protein
VKADAGAWPAARALPLDARLPRLQLGVRALAGLGFALVSGLALLVVSPRFAIGGPSLVDDWWAYSKSPHALGRLVHLAYDPAAVGDPHRYRPGSIAVWNWLVWHTLGAPASLVGPNVWNAVRILLFVGSAMALVAVVLRGRVALAAALPALIVATPAFGRDFARFGPAEPLLVGGMTAGALLLALGLYRRLAGGCHAVVLCAAGYLLWVFGVYQKETSVCFLVAAPFVYLYLDRRWRAAGTIKRPLLRYRPFQVVAVLASLPVLHMAVEVWRVAVNGTTAYGQHVPHAAGGLLERLGPGTLTQWTAMTGALGSPLWVALSLAGLVLAGRALRRREATDWLVAGFVLTGWSVLVFQALSRAETVSRYYLPAVTLFGAATALALAGSARRTQRATLATAAVLVVAGAPLSYWSVHVWAANEREGNALVDRVSGLAPGSCPVYMGRLEPELALSLPVLVGLEGRAAVGCFRGGEPVLVARHGPKPYGSFVSATDDRIFAACRAPGWAPVARTRHFQILACRRLRTGARVATILATDRLAP